MRRLGRYIYNGLTVLSLLICLATVVLWSCVGYRTEMLSYHSGSTVRTIGADRAGIWYIRGTSNPSWGWEHSSFSFGGEPYGFFCHAASHGNGFLIGLPHWFICLITVLAPGIWLTKRLRRKRPPPGLCPKCRYDLRATPDRCPECGTVVAEPGKKLD